MTQQIDLSKIAYGSQFGTFKNDKKASGSTTIPSQSYINRQLRQFSFTIPLNNQLSPSQVYLNFDFESDKWMLLNGSTYVNHPQNFEINCYTSYSTTAITVHLDIINRNGTTTLNAFSVSGNAYTFIPPWI